MSGETRNICGYVPGTGSEYDNEYHGCIDVKCSGTGNVHDWRSSYPICYAQKCDKCSATRNLLEIALVCCEAAITHSKEIGDTHTSIKVASIALNNLREWQKQSP